MLRVRYIVKTIRAGQKCPHAAGGRMIRGPHKPSFTVHENFNHFCLNLPLGVFEILQYSNCQCIYLCFDFTFNVLLQKIKKLCSAD